MEPRPPPDDPYDAPPTSSAFTALAYPGYRLIWIGQAAHSLATWMENIARPLLVLQLTGNDAAQLGGVIAVRTLPTLVLGLWAGVVADWFDRRFVLLAAKGSSLLVAVALVLLVASGQIQLWHVYVLAFLRGSAQAFDQPARVSLVATVLPTRLVVSAIALLSSTQNLARIVGAAGAGLAVAAIGLEGTFLVIVALYAGAVISTHRLEVEAHERPKARGGRAMLAGLAAGLRFARDTAEVRSVLLAALMHFTFGVVYLQVFAPLFAVEVLGIGEAGLGLLLALTGLGAIGAALAIARRPPSRPGPRLPLVVSGLGLVLTLFSASTYLPGASGIVLPCALITLAGALQTAFMTLARSVLVLAAPADLRGRVLSLISLDRAAMSAGAAAAGLLAAATGAQAAQAIFGGICVIGGLAVFALSRRPAKREI